jgi:hypothetical protein
MTPHGGNGMTYRLLASGLVRQALRKANLRGSPYARWVMALERELATFQAHLPNLLATAPGKYVLIHGDNIVGTWNTWGEAIDAGYERFDLGPFLVNQVVAEEEPAYVSQDLL